MGESRTPRPEETSTGYTTGISGDLITRTRRPPANY